MAFDEWMQKKVENIHWTDIPLIKLSAAAFILMIAKIWTPILSLEWYWYALIGAIAALKPLYKMYGK